MMQAPVLDGLKVNGSSIQGRNSNQPGYDMSGPPIVNPIQLFSINLAGIQSDGIPQWSYYPQIRDMYLRNMAKREPIMSGALYSVTSRIKSLRWNITGGRNVKAYYQDLFAQADGGAGYGQFIGKVVTDLLTQDNGAFIEVVGAGAPDKPLKGRVTELWHLDSHQCWRTFDPEFPVIYVNPLDNSYHRLHRSRVIMLSNNPQPDERARNVGFCAVSRALKMMQTIRHIQTYKEEKISGKFKRAIIYGNGLTDKQFKNATEVADATSENSNFMVYNEIPVMLSMMQDMKLNVLDLASLPDGFDYEKEMTIYVYILALCFGTDAREFWPATSSGATKADASVQHLKAQGKGIGDLIKMIETAFNWQIMPSNGSCDFEYDFTDDEQDKQEADIQAVKALNIQTYQTNGWITPQEGRALCIAWGLIDPKQLILTETPEVADDIAPMEDTTLTGENDPDVTAATPQPIAQWTAARHGKKAIDVHSRVNAYQKKLEATATKFVDKVAATPSQFQSSIDDLFNEFAGLLPGELTDAFGVGLAGEKPTPDGIDRLKKVAQTSHDYFKDSYIPALGAVSLAGLGADEIHAALDPFVSRLGMYAGAFWESLWQGARDATPASTRVKRVLDDGAAHCSSCPDKVGEYDSFDDMVGEVGMPGDGSDDCLSNCRCSIETEDDDGGFSPLVGEPTVFTTPLFEVLR